MSKLPRSIAMKNMCNKVSVGDMVRLGVWVCNEWQPMTLGKVVSVESGYIDADVMGIHGGEPWMHSCQTYHYMLESEYQKLKEVQNG